MPKSRSRGKANSNLARDHKMFSTCHLFTWEGLLNAKDGEQYTTAQTYLRMGGWCPMGEYLADQLIKRPRNWMIGVRALCRAPDGTEWMESQMFDLPSRRIGDISDAYHELRAAVLSAQQTRQVYDLGWIAQTWAGRKPHGWSGVQRKQAGHVAAVEQRLPGTAGAGVSGMSQSAIHQDHDLADDQIISLVELNGVAYFLGDGSALLKNGARLGPEQWQVFVSHMIDECETENGNHGR